MLCLRDRTAYKKGRSVLEAMAVPGTVAAALWEDFRDMAVKHMDSKKRLGVAPKTNIERQIEKVLRQLGGWTSRKGPFEEDVGN